MRYHPIIQTKKGLKTSQIIRKNMLKFEYILDETNKIRRMDGVCTIFDFPYTVCVH